MMAVSERALDIAGRVAQGELRAADVLEATLAALPAAAHYNCFTAVTAARAREEAEAIDRRRSRGEALGPLAGVPFAVKNLFDVEGLPTLAGSRINANRAPAIRDAFAIRRLSAAGAVLVGTLNMEEYAYGFTTENAHYGATRNPHDPSRIAGGSSGGSAAAVAAGTVPFALGSDTNGSIRVPAALCGIFGVKPTFGRLSRTGAFPFAPSFDHIGHFARSVTDLAAVYDALLGHDPDDPVSVQRENEPVLPTLSRGIDGLRIAMATGPDFDSFLEPGMRADVEALCQCLGATARVEMRDAAVARAAAFVITAAESSNLHIANLKSRLFDFDPSTRDKFLAGALLPSHWVIQAQRVRRHYLRTMLDVVFANTDVLIAPCTPFPATPIGQDAVTVNGKTVPLRPSLGLFVQPLSFIGLPVVSVPISRSKGLPTGVQIIARPWREDDAFRIAAYLEKEGLVSAPVPPVAASIAGEPIKP